MRLRTLFYLSAGHMVSDLYGGMLAPLLPLILLRYDISMASAGMLLFTMHAFANLSQPLIGILNDNRQRNWLLWAGPLVSALPFAFILRLGSTLHMMAVLVLTGIGIGMYHPISAAVAGRIVRRERQGVSMAIYSSGGALGVILAPLMIVGIVETLGESFMPLVILPAAAMAALYPFQRGIETGRVHYRTFKEWLAALHRSRHALILYWAISSFRSVVYMLIGSFLPVLAVARGMSFAGSAYYLSVSMCAGMVGMFLGGHLSDRHGGRRVLALSLFAASPLLAGFLFSDGIVSLLFLLPGMALLPSTIPVTILLAQRAAPHHAGVASSLVMGMSFLMGAIAAPLFGLLADHIGIENAMRMLIILPALGGLVALLTPAHEAEMMPDVQE